jgi:hypothetical protein
MTPPSGHWWDSRRDLNHPAIVARPRADSRTPAHSLPPIALCANEGPSVSGRALFPARDHHRSPIPAIIIPTHKPMALQVGGPSFSRAARRERRARAGNHLPG